MDLCKREKKMRKRRRIPKEKVLEKIKIKIVPRRPIFFAILIICEYTFR